MADGGFRVLPAWTRLCMCLKKGPGVWAFQAQSRAKMWSGPSPDAQFKACRDLIRQPPHHSRAQSWQPRGQWSLRHTDSWPWFCEGWEESCPAAGSGCWERNRVPPHPAHPSPTPCWACPCLIFHFLEKRKAYLRGVWPGRNFRTREREVLVF